MVRGRTTADPRSATADGTDGPVSIREAHKSLTRQRLVKAAVEVFEELGYHSATIDDIAKRAGVSRTTFYLHFPSKQAVAIANGDVLLERLPKLFHLLTSHKRVGEDEARTFLEALVESMHLDTQANIIALQANVADPELTAKGWRDYLGLATQLLHDFEECGWVARSPHAITELALLFPTISYALWGQGIFHAPPHTPDFMAVLAVNLIHTIDRAVEFTGEMDRL